MHDIATCNMEGNMLGLSRIRRGIGFFRKWNEAHARFTCKTSYIVKETTASKRVLTSKYWLRVAFVESYYYEKEQS